jgi:hypothetical protein
LRRAHALSARSTVGSLVDTVDLNASGDAAWVACDASFDYNAPVGRSQPCRAHSLKRVLVDPANAPKAALPITLGESRTIQPSSLRISGKEVTWRDGTHQASGPLRPQHTSPIAR